MALIKNGEIVSNKEAMKIGNKNKNKIRKINYKDKPCYYIEDKTYHLYDGIVLEEKDGKCKIEWKCRHFSKKGEKHIGYAKIEDILWDKNRI